MRSKSIAQISPYAIDRHLVICLDEKWTEVCNGLPIFSVVIDEEHRLHLIGPKISRVLKIKGDKNE